MLLRIVCMLSGGIKHSLLQGWCPYHGKETVREPVPHGSRQSFHWANHVSLNKNLTSFLEFSVPAPPLVIRQV